MGEPLPSPALRGSRDYHTARSQAWTRHTRAMCTRALRPPQAASPLARMRTAPASPRAPRFHLAVNRTPTRLRPTPGACDRRWCRHARRRIWETLVRVPLAQQPSVRRGTEDLCPGRQVSSVQALLCVKEMVLWSCGRGEGQSFWYYVGCKGFSDCNPVKTGISAIPDLGLGSGHGGADGGEEAGPFWVAGRERRRLAGIFSWLPS